MPSLSDFAIVLFRPGRLISSRAVNRVATLVFMIDDRFYGTIIAFVRGAQSECTSGLAVRLLGALMPTRAPLLVPAPQPGAAAELPSSINSS